MPMKFPLMRNNILREDLDAVIEHLRQDDPILTHGANVRAFEQEWSEWLGVKHSVFVNSGASANLLTMAILKLRHPDGGEVIVPPLTWVSDIASVMQNGFEPVFADIDPRSLAMDPAEILSRITRRTRAVFLTHVQGFDGLTDELVAELEKRKIPLIEDVCESHGATHNGRRLGSFGWISNFSFYYAHHMSTIEGGMVCTNDPEVFQQVRMLRSHGMTREATDPAVAARYKSEFPDLNPDFIFAFPSYNARNTEIGGILGRSPDDPDMPRRPDLRIDVELVGAHHVGRHRFLALAAPLVLEFDGDRTLGHATYGEAYEGPPGSVHGGYVISAFDDLLGVAQAASGTAGFTGTLSVRLVARTPLHERIDYEAEVSSHSGRKVVVSGRSSLRGETLAEATGIFIAPKQGIELPES